MTISIVLDVAVGLFFIFFVLSTLVSAINEIIGDIFQRRVNNMSEFIVEIMKTNAGDEELAKAAKLIEDFYNSNVVKTKREFPLLKNLLNGLKKPNVPGSENVNFIPSGNFAQAVLEIMGFARQTYATADDAVTGLKGLLAMLPADSPLRTEVTTALNQADKKVTDVTSHIETWFNGQMAILSDIYKRRTQFWLFFIGIILALVLNINTLAIVNALATNPSLRGALVEQANTLVQNNANSTEQTVLTCGTDADGKPKTYDRKDPQKVLEYTNCVLGSQLSSLEIPFLWREGFFPANAPAGSNERAIIGILLTGLAVSFGGPFWYDLIKVLTTRSSGGKSESK